MSPGTLPPRPRHLILDWTALFSLATAAATAAGIVSFAPMVARMLAWEAFPATTVLFLTTLALGAVHGFAVAVGQAALLRRQLQTRVRGWILATTAGAAVAWAGCMVLNVQGVAAGISDADWMRLVVPGGLAFGGFLGLAQWLALRRVVPHAALWIPANGIAWLLASLVVIFGFPFANKLASPVAGAAIVTVTALAASLVAGFTTALALVWIVKRAGRVEAMRLRRVEDLIGRTPGRNS